MSLLLNVKVAALQTGSNQPNLFQRNLLYHSLRSAGINGFGISERFLHIDTRSFGYTPDADFGSYALWYY
jgi:hypothetical protein